MFQKTSKMSTISSEGLQSILKDGFLITTHGICLGEDSLIGASHHRTCKEKLRTTNKTMCSGKTAPRRKIRFIFPSIRRQSWFFPSIQRSIVSLPPSSASIVSSPPSSASIVSSPSSSTDYVITIIDLFSEETSTSSTDYSS